MYSLYLNLSLSVSYGTFTIKEHDKPNYFSQKKYWKNKNMRPFFISLSSISAIPLPQTNCNNFFFLLFRQCHCHKSIATLFFSLPISAMPLPQIHSHIFFSLYFDNGIATNQLQQFFFPPISAMPLPQINCHFFFFFFNFNLFKKWHVHTIFTTSLKRQVVIVRLKK